MNQLDSQLLIRCPSAVRKELKSIRNKLQISESSLVRAALREGLKVVLEHGIRVDGAASGAALNT